MNTNKVYAPHVTAQQMSIDGWSRDFDVPQTVEEMRAMGVDITPEQLLEAKFCDSCLDTECYS